MRMRVAILGLLVVISVIGSGFTATAVIGGIVGALGVAFALLFIERFLDASLRRQTEHKHIERCIRYVETHYSDPKVRAKIKLMAETNLSNVQMSMVLPNAFWPAIVAIGAVLFSLTTVPVFDGSYVWIAILFVCSVLWSYIVHVEEANADTVIIQALNMLQDD